MPGPITQVYYLLERPAYSCSGCLAITTYSSEHFINETVTEFQVGGMRALSATDRDGAETMIVRADSLSPGQETPLDGGATSEVVYL